MKYYSSFFLTYIKNRKYLFAFCTVWCLGIVVGYAYARALSDELLITIQNSVLTSTNIWSTVLSGFIPFLLFAVTLRYFPGLTLFPYLFFKAVLFFFCSFSIHLAFGSAGWLMQILLLFSDSCLLLPMLWCLLKWFSGEWSYRSRAFFTFAFLSAVVPLVDYYIVNPFCLGLS